MPRNIAAETAGMTPQEKWHYLYGTDAYGNLPQHKKHEHVGHCWNPCPYSSTTDTLKTRLMLGLSEGDPLPARVSHVDSNGMEYYLTTQSRRGVWGYECTYSGCSYLLSTGNKYFYV